MLPYAAFHLGPHCLPRYMFINIHNEQSLFLLAGLFFMLFFCQKIFSSKLTFSTVQIVKMYMLGPSIYGLVTDIQVMYRLEIRCRG